MNGIKAKLLAAEDLLQKDLGKWVDLSYLSVKDNYWESHFLPYLVLALPGSDNEEERLSLGVALQSLHLGFSYHLSLLPLPVLAEPGSVLNGDYCLSQFMYRILKHGKGIYLEEISPIMQRIVEKAIAHPQIAYWGIDTELSGFACRKGAEMAGIQAQFCPLYEQAGRALAVFYHSLKSGGEDCLAHHKEAALSAIGYLPVGGDIFLDFLYQLEQEKDSYQGASLFAFAEQNPAQAECSEVIDIANNNKWPQLLTIISDMEVLEEELKSSLVSDENFLQKTAQDLLTAGGKRIRPSFAFLSGALLAGEDKKEALLPLAKGLELIHMASLIHDDILDRAAIRRGKPTCNGLYGDRNAALLGDFILAKACILGKEYDKFSIGDIIAKASVEMCKGEFSQLAMAFKPQKQNVRHYLQGIYRKTAMLISVSCWCGALLAEADRKTVAAMRRFGYNLGMSFQITDDILDFRGNENHWGKEVCRDLGQGIITLPLIYALEKSPYKESLAEICSKGNLTQREKAFIIEKVEEVGGFAYANDFAAYYLKKARLELAKIQGEKDTLAELMKIVDFIGSRKY